MGRRRVHPGARRATAVLAAAVLAGVTGFGATSAVGATGAQAPPTTEAPVTTIPGGGTSVPTTGTTIPGPTIPTPSTTIVTPTTGTSVPGPTVPTTLVPPTTGTSVPGPTIPPSTTTTEPVPPGERVVTATPATGLQPGDTITVAGTGFTPDMLVGISGCTEAARGVTGIPWDVCDVLVALLNVAPDGTFTADIVVSSPGWELVHVLEAAADASPLIVDLDVATPAGPAVTMTLTSDEVVAGEVAYAQGYAWPVELAADARSMSCADVPASATDPAAVEAACGPIADATAPSTSGTGRIFASEAVAEGDEALWVGVPLDGGGLLGQVLPLEVLPPPPPYTVTVTPAEDLVDGQVVAVSGSGAQGVFGWPGLWVTQCRGSVLDDGRLGTGEFMSSCAYGMTGPPVAVAEDGTFTGELAVARELVTFNGTVHCDVVPEGCAVVVLAPYSEPLYRSGGTLVSFRPVPPVVAPQAARVVEGDDGATAAEVPVRLDRPSATPVTVEWTTFDWPPLPWAATYGEDATPAAGTLTFAPGEVEATITVDVLGDTAAEGEEMALLGLTSAEGATVGGFAGIGGVVIDDDD